MLRGLQADGGDVVVVNRGHRGFGTGIQCFVVATFRAGDAQGLALVALLEVVVVTAVERDATFGGTGGDGDLLFVAERDYQVGFRGVSTAR
nr:hypothetical protein [Halomonas sp. hl-4]